MLRLLSTAIIILAPTLALAHPGHGADGLAAGFAHPISGIDHVLAMVAVGCLAAQIGGRALWALPAAFMGMMMAGGALYVAGVPFHLWHGLRFQNAVWHGFVLVATAFFYSAVLGGVVLPHA